MKKMLTWILILCLSFSLPACGRSNAVDRADVPETDVKENVEKPETVSESADKSGTEIPESNEQKETGGIAESEGSTGSENQTLIPEQDDSNKENVEGTGMQLTIGDQAVSVDWEDNESVTALMELCTDAPLSIQMSMYGGFEQVGSIGASLPREDTQTTTSAGDIVLYSGNQMVIFYGSNSWSYTRLGKIINLSEDELAGLLGNGDVTISISTN